MTDQTDLTSIIFSQTEFINLLVEKLDNTQHTLLLPDLKQVI